MNNIDDLEDVSDDNQDICKAWYILRLNESKDFVDISQFVIFNSDVAILIRIQEECDDFYVD